MPSEVAFTRYCYHTPMQAMNHNVEITACVDAREVGLSLSLSLFLFLPVLLHPLTPLLPLFLYFHSLHFFWSEVPPFCSKMNHHLRHTPGQYYKDKTRVVCHTWCTCKEMIIGPLKLNVGSFITAITQMYHRQPTEVNMQCLRIPLQN